LTNFEFLKEGFKIMRGPIVKTSLLPIVSEKDHYKRRLRSAGNVATIDGGRGKREIALALESD
jgi:hypothetical protein